MRQQPNARSCSTRRSPPWPRFADSEYVDIEHQIVKLDPQNVAGLKSKYESAVVSRELDAVIQNEIYPLADRGKYAAAIARLDRLIAQTKSPRPQLQLLTAFKGQLYYSLGDKRQAARFLDDAIAIDPQSESAARAEPQNFNWLGFLKSCLGPTSKPFVCLEPVLRPGCRKSRFCMKRKRHSRADILLKVREANDHLAAGVPLEEIQRKQQVSLQTLQRWLRDYGGLQPESLSRLTQLEQENRRLRKAVAGLEFDKRILSEAVRGNF